MFSPKKTLICQKTNHLKSRRVCRIKTKCDNRQSSSFDAIWWCHQIGFYNSRYIIKNCRFHWASLSSAIKHPVTVKVKTGHKKNYYQAWCITIRKLWKGRTIYNLILPFKTTCVYVNLCTLECLSTDVLVSH